MQSLNVPYGHSFMTADIPENNFAGTYFSALPQAAANESAEVCRALDEPIGSLPLEELAKGKKNAVEAFLGSEGGDKKISGFTNLKDFAQSLESPRKILLMVFQHTPPQKDRPAERIRQQIPPRAYR